MFTVQIEDNKVLKKFNIEKMKCTACDTFSFLAMKALIKDDVQFPEELVGADIRQVLHDVLQDGRSESKATKDKGKRKDNIGKILNNLIGILRSAFSNLENEERIFLLNQLLCTVTYVNGVIENKLSYLECDNYIDNFLTIYKLAWEVLKVNFPLLSTVKE